MNACNVKTFKRFKTCRNNFYLLFSSYRPWTKINLKSQTFRIKGVRISIRFVTDFTFNFCTIFFERRNLCMTNELPDILLRRGLRLWVLGHCILRSTSGNLRNSMCTAKTIVELLLCSGIQNVKITNVQKV